MRAANTPRCRALTAIALAVGLAAFSAGLAADSRPYMYRDKQGVPWFTDRPLIDPDFIYLGRHGRPPAERSCQGMTETRLARRAAWHEPLIRQNAQRYQINSALIKAIIAVESCFDPKAVSRVGAQGLMQLMPRTAAALGVADVFNPEQNVSGGVRYFRQMLERFKNDVRLALAAYNAGPGAVSRHGGIPPYPETQRYVERVLELYQGYR